MDHVYWLPYAGADILAPTLVALVILVPAAELWRRRYAAAGDRPGVGVLVPLVGLSFIALLGVCSAIGYSAIDLAIVALGANTTAEATRWGRVGVVIVAMTALGAALYVFRGHWRKVLRLLALLGYVYSVLAIVRLSHYPLTAFWSGDATSPLQYHAAPRLETTAGTSRPRQVVWIIFDELDFNRTLGRADALGDPPLPNLDALSRRAVSASQAYSPARDTIASLPALLTGYSLFGLYFDQEGRLWLNTRANGFRPFEQSDSVFGRLPGGPQSAAVLGYYHPYCRTFPSVDPCLAFPVANVGRWFDALLFFGRQTIATARWLPGMGQRLPGGVLDAFDPMYRITHETLRQFGHFLALRDKSLVFIHVNLPHLPADYAQRVLRLRKAASDGAAYSHNLVLVDQLVGLVVSDLRGRVAQNDTLLIVSTDHWFRLASPSVPQRIPWIAWHVGESSGERLDFRISTVHTAELVLDFLRGRVNNQSDILRWWHGKSFYPPLMPPYFRQ